MDFAQEMANMSKGLKTIRESGYTYERDDVTPASGALLNLFDASGAPAGTIEGFEVREIGSGARTWPPNDTVLTSRADWTH